MPITKITADTINRFFELTDQGLTQRKAAVQLGVGVESLRIAATRLSIPWPERKGLRHTLLERADEIQSSTKTQKQWAQEFGVSQCRIAILFKELGFKSKFSNGQGRQAEHGRRYNEFRQIIGYIAQHGGYVTHAIKALGLKTPPQLVRDYAKSIGFNLEHYQFAYQEYGEWLTLPGPWERKMPNNYIVPALCRSCGEVFKLNLQNARVGKSNCCQTCCNINRSNCSVINVETGERFSSIMSWAKTIGQLNSYQRLRIQLNREGTVTVDGTLYQLVH